MLAEEVRALADRVAMLEQDADAESADKRARIRARQLETVRGAVRSLQAVLEAAERETAAAALKIGVLHGQ